MRRKNRRHGLIAAAREVCNATRRLGDGSRLILRQRVRGSVRAVRAVRNTRVFQTETGVVADVTDNESINTPHYSYPQRPSIFMENKKKGTIISKRNVDTPVFSIPLLTLIQIFLTISGRSHISSFPLYIYPPNFLPKVHTLRTHFLCRFALE